MACEKQEAVRLGLHTALRGVCAPALPPAVAALYRDVCYDSRIQPKNNDVRCCTSTADVVLFMWLALTAYRFSGTVMPMAAAVS